jgi:hypothetical protein
MRIVSIIEHWANSDAVLVHAVVASGAILAADLAKRLYPNRDFDLPNRRERGLLRYQAVRRRMSASGDWSMVQ